MPNPNSRPVFPLKWILAAVIALAAPAWAVVPGLTGPLQALAQMIPQILPLLGVGLAGLLSSAAWRARLARFGRWVATPAGSLTLLVVLGAATGAVFLLRSGNRSRTAVAAPAGPGGASDWTMFRGNLARTGSVPSSTGPSQASVAWTFSDPAVRVADLSSSPAVVGDRIYTGSAQASVFDSTGMVYCLDNAGKRVWQFQTEKQVFSSPAVVGGRVYVGEGLHVDTNCKLYCLDAATGKKLWATPTKSHTEASPAVTGGRVYTGAGEDGMYALDAATGKVAWHQGGMHVDVSPAVAAGKVYVGTGYGKLAAMALDANTGKPAWTTPCDLPVWGPPSLSGRFVYFGIGNGDFQKSADKPRGGVWCLDAATGKQAWRQDLPDAVLTAVSVQNGRLFAGCRDGKVYALDAATGKPAWSTPCGGPVVSSPAVDSAHVYAAGGKGQVFCLDAGTGQPVWTLDLAAQTAPDVKLFSSPALANGRLYIGTSKEKFVCVGK